MQGAQTAGEAAAPLRVLVADDDPLARRVLRSTLEEAGLSVLAEATHSDELLERVTYHRPDVVVLKLGLPGLDTAVLLGRIASAAQGTSTIVLAGRSDEEAGVRMLRAGAAGFLSKDIELGALPRAVVGAARGEAAVSRQMAMRVIRDLRSLPADGRGLRPVRSKLTSREWEVVDLLLAGASYQEVSEELVLALDTVYSHAKRIMRKLGVHDREELIRVAAEHRAASLSASE